MNNYVDIENPLLKFSAYNFKTSDFMRLVEKIEHNTAQPENDEDLFLWRFISSNSYSDKNMVKIILGGGRSAHTWLDLNRVMGMLGQWAKRIMVVRLRLRDEADGFSETIHIPYSIVPKESRWLKF